MDILVVSPRDQDEHHVCNGGAATDDRESRVEIDQEIVADAIAIGRIHAKTH